jgi:hypothetical protein
MLQSLSRNDIDKKKWDDCVLAAHCSSIYGTSVFLDTISDQWDALVWGDYEAVMPLPFRKKYGIHYLYQPLFTQQLGIYKKEKITRAESAMFLDGIPDKFKYASVNLNPDCFVYEGDKKLYSRDNFIVDLNHSYESLHHNFSDKTRATLKQSKAYQLRLEPLKDSWKIIQLFSEYNIKYANRFAKQDYERLVKLINIYSEEHKVEQLGVFNGDGVLCSGGVFIKHLNRNIFLFSGNSQLGRQQRGMFFLLDCFIQKHAGTEMYLDFAGTTDPGLARFYKGFGSSIEHYPRLDFNYLPWPLNIIKK